MDWSDVVARTKGDAFGVLALYALTSPNLVPYDIAFSTGSGSGQGLWLVQTAQYQPLPPSGRSFGIII